MKRLALLTIAALAVMLFVACDQTDDISAPDQVPATEDLVFNACVSRLWDGLDWEGTDRTVAWGPGIARYCVWRMDRGLEPVHSEVIDAMRNEHDWAREAPRGR